MSEKHTINLDLERILLGALIAHPKWTHSASTWLEPHHLWCEAHRVIFGALISLAERGKDASMASLRGARGWAHPDKCCGWLGCRDKATQ